MEPFVTLFKHFNRELYVKKQRNYFKKQRNYLNVCLITDTTDIHNN